MYKTQVLITIKLYKHSIKSEIGLDKVLKVRQTTGFESQLVDEPVISAVRILIVLSVLAHHLLLAHLLVDEIARGQPFDAGKELHDPARLVLESGEEEAVQRAHHRQVRQIRMNRVLVEDYGHSRSLIEFQRLQNRWLEVVEAQRIACAEYHRVCWLVATVV